MTYRNGPTLPKASLDFNLELTSSHIIWTEKEKDFMASNGFSIVWTQTQKCDHYKINENEMEKKKKQKKNTHTYITVGWLVFLLSKETIYFRVDIQFCLRWTNLQLSPFNL